MALGAVLGTGDQKLGFRSVTRIKRALGDVRGRGNVIHVGAFHPMGDELVERDLQYMLAQLRGYFLRRPSAFWIARRQLVSR